MGSGGQRSIKKRAPAAAAPTKAPTSAEEFSKLSASQQWQITQKAIAGKPANSYFAYNTPFQKFINNSGMDDKPQVLDSKAFDKADGLEVYRTVKTNSSFKALDIAKNVANDTGFLFNAAGGTAYGKGLYVTPYLPGSMGYGRGATGKNAAVMRFKIKPDAKIINLRDLENQYSIEARKPGTLAHTLDTRIPKGTGWRPVDNQLAIFAMSKGYTVVTAARGTDQRSLRRNMRGNDAYTMILSRKAIIMDAETKTRTFKRGSLQIGWHDLIKNGMVK